MSQSFGSVSSGAGTTQSAIFTITNVGTVARSYTASVEDGLDDGVTFSGSASFTLAPGASATVTVNAAATRAAPDGHKQGTLRVTDGSGEVAHAMLYALVGEGARAPGRHMLPPPQA